MSFLLNNYSQEWVAELLLLVAQIINSLQSYCHLNLKIVYTSQLLLLSGILWVNLAMLSASWSWMSIILIVYYLLCTL